MKTTIYFTVISAIWFVALNAFAQGTCDTGGGNFGSPLERSPYDRILDVAEYEPVGFVEAKQLTPSAPQARITLGDSSLTKLRTLPTARLTLSTNTPSQVAEKKPAEEESSLPPHLKGLVGTWLAVARHGDGELTTVELQLDSRGWATLTVPGADGKPSKSKRRVRFEDQEIKLIGPDAETSLGTLLEHDTRQMVLAQPEGQLTFVRS